MSKIILVTGSNSGIGLELVRLLAERGHIVYIGARNDIAGNEAKDKLYVEGFKTVKFVLLDVINASSIEAAKSAIEAAEGKLDVLVNNAGIGKLELDQTALSISLPVIREVMETNFLGLVQTTIAFVPLLRKSTQGVIVNVSSDLASNTHQAAPKAYGHFVGYNASKVAVNSYTIILAHQLKEEGIKVNAVTPGYTATKLTAFGPGAKTVKEGAHALLPFVLLDKDGPTGKFFNSKGEEWQW